MYTYVYIFLPLHIINKINCNSNVSLNQCTSILINFVSLKNVLILILQFFSERENTNKQTNKTEEDSTKTPATKYKVLPSTTI